MRTLALMAWCGLLASSGMAQAQDRSEPLARAFAYITGDSDRPRLGLTTRSTGERDTLGLLVESVTRDGPADRAGITEGDRLMAINDVNLRLSPADAGTPEMRDIPYRRLVRELDRHEPGDSVALRVYRDGQTLTLRVRTATAEEMSDRWFVSQGARSGRNRAVLGISLGGSGSERDTLGILVVGVTDGGPADSAGIDEGDRIAAIGTTDLRVAREDAGDWVATNARIRRLQRELEDLEPGTEVQLRVVTAGQARTVRVRTARASDLRSTSGPAFYFGDGPGRVLESLRSLPRIEVSPSIRRRVELDRVLEESRRAAREAQGRGAEAARVRALEIQRRVREAEAAAQQRARDTQREALRRAQSALREVEQMRLHQGRLWYDLDDTRQRDGAAPSRSATRVSHAVRII